LDLRDLLRFVAMTALPHVSDYRSARARRESRGVANARVYCSGVQMHSG
jgi:hypothetical protein